MKPTYTLHKLPEGFIITSDEIELNENCYEYDVLGLFAYNPTHNIFGIITQADDKRVTIGDSVYTTQTGDTIYDIININGFKVFKTIAQQDQIDFSTLSEEKQKEIGWFDIEKLADNEVSNKVALYPNDYWNRKEEWINGFQKAQELLSDRKFTEKEVMKAMKHAVKYYSHMWDDSDGEKIIHSLFQLKSCKVELETEDKCCCLKPQSGGCIECIKVLKKINSKIKILK